MFRGVPSIVDVEASGFGPHSYPIEIGVVRSNGDRYCSLILPAEEWVFWDEGAEKVHHISREILEKHGKPLHVVAEELNTFLEGETVYTDGWVVDSTWIKQLYFSAHKQMYFSVSSLEMILKEPQMEIWHAVKDELEAQKEGNRHRASFDAALIQETFVKTAALTTSPARHV